MKTQALILTGLLSIATIVAGSGTAMATTTARQSQFSGSLCRLYDSNGKEVTGTQFQGTAIVNNSATTFTAICPVPYDNSAVGTPYVYVPAFNNTCSLGISSGSYPYTTTWIPTSGGYMYFPTNWSSLQGGANFTCPMPKGTYLYSYKLYYTTSP